MASAPARSGKWWLLTVLCVLLSVMFLGLSAWQWSRLQWKQDLISRVNARVHTAPITPPGAKHWPLFATQTQNRARDQYEYLRVQIAGQWRHDQSVWVATVTVYGQGYWLLTPVQTSTAMVWINRGFVARRDAQLLRPTDATVIGLLRLSEPHGRVLRANHPEADKWYSRDIQAMSAQRQLSNVAPYFIDAEANDKDSVTEPVTGLTVLNFPNHHLQYAITWLLLALLPVLFIFRMRHPVGDQRA